MVLYLFFLLFAVTGLFWLMTIPAKQRVAVLSTAGPVLVIMVGSVADPVTTWGNWYPPDYYWSFMVAAKSFETTDQLR